MAAGDHPVGHHRRQQRFDRREEGDHERRGEQLGHPLDAHVRNRGHRQAAGQFAELAADRLDRKREDHGRSRHRADREDETWEARVKPLERDYQHQRGDACGNRDPVGAGPGGPQRRHLGQEVGRQVIGGDPGEILQLAACDDDRDADGEPVDHRLGHVGDEVPGSQQARDEQDYARHQRREHEPVVAVLGDHAVDDHDERARGPADLDPAAAECGDKKPGDDRGHQPRGRVRARSDRDRDAQRQRHHRDADPGDEVAQEQAPGVIGQRRQELGLHPVATTPSARVRASALSRGSTPSVHRSGRPRAAACPSAHGARAGNASRAPTCGACSRAPNRTRARTRGCGRSRAPGRSG